MTFKNWVHAALVLSLFWCAGSAFAKSITLVVWAADQREVFTEQIMQYELAELKSKAPALEVRSIFFGIEPKIITAELIESKILELNLSEDDTISTLVIGTHGDANAETSTLARLGNFNSAGKSFGELGLLLEQLGPRFSPQLTIVFSSCSVLEGKESDAKKRVNALFERVKTLGVGDLRVWGATQVRFKNFSSEKLKNAYQFYAKGIMTAFNVVAFVIAYQHYRDAFNQSSIAGFLGDVIPASITLSVSYTLSRVVYSISDQGRLIQINDHRVDVLKTPNYSPEVVAQMPCGELLQVNDLDAPINASR